MADVFNTNIDNSSQKNAVHLSRRGEVIFVKKAKLFPDAGFSGNSQSDETVRRLQEFIDSGVLKESQGFELRDENPDDPLNPDIHKSSRHMYWTVSTSSIGAVSKVGGTSQLLPNADVEHISVTPCASAPSTATVTIRNPLEKYSVKKNPMYLGQTVFESDDLVYINLPGLDGKLYRRFTGLVTTVATTSRASDTGFDHIIQIECSDMLKRLWECRTNVKPSLTSSEAQGAAASIYDNALADLLPHQIMAKVLVRVYSDIYSIAGARAQLATIRGLDPNTGAEKEEEFLASFEQVPSSGTASSPFLTADGTITVTGGTVQKSSDFVSVTQDVSKDVPKRIYGYRQAPKVNFTTIDSIFQVGLSVLTSGGNHPADDLAFVIEGTTQPVYQKTFNQFSLMQIFNSEWKSSYEVAKAITETVGFELNTTVEGVVRFRPLNNLLPADIKNQETTAFTSDPTKTRVGYEYWLQKPYIVSETLTDTDDGIITIMQVMGHFDYSNLDASQINLTTIGRAIDVEKMSRLGIRPGPQLTKISLLTKEACETAAMASLIKINANARSGSIVYLGDARIKPGNPCYLPHRNRVYYIDSIQDDFKPGVSYTMTLTLKYGRVPIAITSEKAAELAKTIATADPTLNNLIQSNYIFPSPITSRKNSGLLDPITRQPMVESSDVERYILHGPTNTQQQTAGVVPSGDGQLVFNGFVWEDLPTCTFEELQEDFKITNTALAANEAAQEARNNDSRRVNDVVSVTTIPGTPANQAKTIASKNQGSKIASTHGTSGTW